MALPVPRETFIGGYALRILLPAKIRGDCDNRIKAVSDFLVAQKITPDDRGCNIVSAERSDEVEHSDQCIVIVESLARQPAVRGARGPGGRKPSGSSLTEGTGAEA